MDPTNSYGGGYQNPGGGIPPPRGYALSGKIMLSAIVVLFAVVLFILFLHLYVRWHLLRLASRRRRGRRRGLVFGAEGEGPNAARGLDPEALKSLPVLFYSAGGDGGGDVMVECAVCLSEFEEGDAMRSLPRCGHRFHIECIDMWFHSHATCPLCRSAVKTEKRLVPAAGSVLIQAADELSPPPAAAESEDGTGSSSSTSAGVELRIAVPERRGPEEELGLGTGSPTGFKSPGGRIQAIRRILSRDLRLYRSGVSVDEPDLERGEGTDRSPPPPLPSPPMRHSDTRPERGRTRPIDG